MLNYSYYPFKKKLEEINFEDLLLLKDVSEGWYIDYKVRGLKIRDFAKHLAAFANQYGGWLIIGVNESSDGSRTASEFLGIPNSDLEKVSIDIREASSAHVNPEVLYEERVIEGPVKEIGLSENSSILIIGIPMSFKTPHIHSSGRIYRRVADQSSPKEETERYILDDLWKRGNSFQENISKLLTNIPDLPVSQSESSWAHIYLMQSKSQLAPHKRLSFSDFSTVMNDPKSSQQGLHLPMNAISSSSGGFVARQVSNKHAGLAALTFRWWDEGLVRIDIPLNSYDLNAFVKTHGKSQNVEDYCMYIYEGGNPSVKIVDYSILIHSLAALINSYLRLLEITEDVRDVYSCFTLRNIFHTAPFLDSDHFVSRAKEFSLPVTLDKNIVIPREPTENNMFLHKYNERKYGDASQVNSLAIPYIFSSKFVFPILESVGIFRDIKDFTSDKELFSYDKINLNFNNLKNI
jgi:hypothetical protein